MSTSKKILWLNYAIVIILTALTVVCTILQINSDGLAVVCGVAYTELGAHTIFYAKKAQTENKIKLSYGMIDKMADKYGIEHVVQLFDIVNRD